MQYASSHTKYMYQNYEKYFQTKGLFSKITKFFANENFQPYRICSFTDDTCKTATQHTPYMYMYLWDITSGAVLKQAVFYF